MKNKPGKRARALLVLLFACMYATVSAQSPGGVGGAVVWLRADQGVTTSGTNVISWVNQTGGTNFTGTRNPQLIANQVNFQPGILFSGNNYLTSNASLLSNSAPYTKFIVFRYDGATTTNNLVSSNEGGTHALYGANTNTDLVLFHDGNVLTASNVVNGSRYFLSTAGFSSGLTNGTYINVDGGMKARVTSSTPYIASKMTLGTYKNGNYLSGRIAEVIVYPTALATGSTSTMQIESYLGLKYGINLSHNYLASDAAVVYNINSFANNIAGIGRDDNSALNQKQSVSILDGSQVIMSLGTVAATNAANTGTFASNRQFLVWGDNNSVINATTAINGWSNVTHRINRIWKLQNTGAFNQQVTVYFPAVSLSALPGNNPNLIFNTSSTLAGGGTEVAPGNNVTINGTVYKSYTVTFPTTGTLYFTFASKMVNPGNVAGAIVWAKTDAGLVTSGNNVTSWVNQMNAGNSFIGTGNPQLTPANVNFNTGVLFGGNNYLTTSGNTLTGNSPYTKFVVFKYENASTNNIVSSVSGNALFGNNTTTDVWLWHNGNILGATNSVNTSRYFMATGGFTRSLTGGTYINIDGTTKNTGTSAAAYVTSPTQLGAYNNAAFMNGRISEVIIFPGSLGAGTAATRKVESYLGLKYGISVGHDYLASDGTTTTYSIAGFANNIAGIGRDDNTALYQKQGRSINPGTSQVLMTLNTYAASNQQNNGTIANDNQYLIWGDNNGSLTSTTAITGWTTSNTRLTRIWKLQNTNGFSQQVTVYFPATTLNYLPGTNPYLIYNSSATLAGGGTEVAASSTVTIDGVACKGFTVTFPTTGTLYFSFGSKAVNPGNIAGAAVWLRPDAGLLTNGNNVTGWVNQVNAANSFTPTANPQAAVSEMNFHSGVLFGGSNYMTSSGTVLPANTAYTKFVVFKYDGASTNNILSAGATGSTAFYGNNTITDLAIFHNGLILSAPNVTNDSRYFIATAGYSAGVTNGTFIGVDGTTRAQATLNVAHPASTLQLGAYSNGNNLNGRIAEVIVYPSALGNNTLNTRKITSYLGLKYGISLGHDYVASDGTTITYSVATHNNGIGGIGRDDDEGLHQVQGVNDLTGAQVCMTLGDVKLNHSDNLNTITSDKQFLVWGHDNGSITASTIVNGYPTVNQRLTRVWKLQNTGGFNQQVNVYFPTAQLNLLSNNTKYLIFNTNSTFTGTGTEVASSGTIMHKGVQFTVFKVTFPTTGILYLSFASKAIFPGAVSGAAVWLRGDAGVNANGTTVSSWVNQSNTANNFNAVGNVQTNNSLVNFNPSMVFNGSSYLASAANVTTANNTSYTKFVVFRSAAGAGTRNLVSALNGSPGTALYTQDNSLRVVQNGAVQMNAPANLVNPGRQYLAMQLYNSGVSNGSLIRLNGATNGVATLNVTHSIDRLAIGAYNSSNLLIAESNIAEVVMYNSALSYANFYKVESYLSLKYGITLGYDYQATNASTIYGVAGYGFHVAGIGRDDNTGLYQRQARSADGGNQVVMSLGQAAASNDDNTNSITSDLQFLIWGDNDGAGFIENTAISQKRLTRTWKLQNTGSFNEAVTVYYPASGLNGLGADPKLIYGTVAALNDGTASQVSTTGVTQIGGENYYSFQLTFPLTGVQYFSFAGKIVPEICGNGIDDDLDGYVDDLDTDCSPIPGCTTTAPALTNFSIRQEWASTTNNALAASVSPTVADLDGDGIPEVLAVRAGGVGITVFKGDGSDAGKNSIDYNLQLPIRVNQSTMQPAVADIDRDGVPEVVVVGSDAYVYVFNNVSGSATNYKFKSTDTITTKYRNGSPRIADIDEDGVPEIIVGLDVFQFNFRDGRLIKAIAGPNHLPAGFGFRAVGSDWGCDIVVIDIMPNNPGKEIVAGSQVYAPNLFYGTLSPLANLSTATSGAIPANNDGPTAVADLDGDGQLDIAYSNGTRFIIWDPVASSVKLNLAYTVGSGSLARGMPTVANVYNEKVRDGKATDLPEVLFNVDNAMYAYNLNKLTGPVWTLTTADNSGETGVTAFDLNGDGTLEIIYNDEQLIRVINGNLATPVNIATYSSGTATWMEHPVVVDVDNDGSAEFVCVSGPAGSFPGNLRVFGATTGTTPWQNTRKVWNGRGYRARGINDDLSVPVKEQNILLQYPAGSGRYPLNNYNAQIDTRTLDPGIIAAADLELSALNVPKSETTCEFTPANAKLIFTVSNNGSAAAQVGTPFRFYLKDPRKAGAIRLPVTYSLKADIPSGESLKDTVTLNLSAYTAPYSIYVVSNDDGSATIPFTLPIINANSKECDYNNNVDSLVLNPLFADFGNFSATWPAASASIRTVDAAWLGTGQPNAECAASETDGADGLVMTGGRKSGNGTKATPWIVDGIDTECKFTITVNGNGDPKPVYYAVWYDADGNGSFTDALDLFTSGELTHGSPVSTSFSFVVPPALGATNGNIRVIAVAEDPGFTKEMNGTGNFMNGEVEDYFITYAAPLPITLKDFTATATGNCSVQLKWNTSMEANSSHFDVQFYDGKEFVTIATVASNNIATGSSYSFVHNISQEADAIYRLMHFDIDGKFQISRIAAAKSVCTNTAIRLLPNPVVASAVISGLKSGDRMKVYNAEGQLMLEVISGGYSHTIDLKKQPAGMYMAQIIRNGTMLTTIKVVKK